MIKKFLYTLGMCLLAGCHTNNNADNPNQTSIKNKFDTTRLTVEIIYDDSIVDTNEIDENFRITILDNKQDTFSPVGGIITLPVFDTIPVFSIEYKDLNTKFSGDMPKYEGKHLFSKNASKINIIVDTYPFDSNSIAKFKGRQLSPKNYFLFIETNSMGWNWRALEER